MFNFFRRFFFKRRQLIALHKAMWLAQMDQATERDILDTMERNKESLERKAKMEENLMETLGQSSKYEDRQQLQKVRIRKQDIDKMIEEQDKEIKKCYIKIENFEAKEVKFRDAIVVVREKF